MKFCKHCRQTVANYNQHFPACPVVRAAVDPDFWPGWVGHYVLSDVEQASRWVGRNHGARADKKRRAAMDAGITR